MSRYLLEQQADQIDAVLQQHHIPARVTGGTETPAETRFRVVPGASKHVNQINALARALGETLGEQIVVQRRGAAVDVVVIKPQPETVLVSTVYQQYRRYIKPMTAVLGIDSDGVGLFARMTNTDIVGNIAAPRGLLPTIATSLTFVLGPDKLAIPTDLPEIGTLGPARQMPYREAVNGLARLVKRREVVGLQPPYYVVAVLSADVPAPILERGPRCGVHVVQSSGGQQITAPWKYGLWINHRHNGTMTAVDRGGGRHTFYPAEVSNDWTALSNVRRTRKLARNA
jgi:hypothetical protein